MDVNASAVIACLASLAVAATACSAQTQPDPPTLEEASGGQTSVGGLVLVSCGVDSLGRPYQSEMLIFRDRDTTLQAIDPAYWGSYDIATIGHTTRSSPAPTSRCP